MKQTFIGLVAAIALSTVVASCQGNGAVSLTNPLPAIQSYIQQLRTAVTPQQAVTQTSADPSVQQKSATDLVPYRSEFDATLNVWIVYYFSPSKNKSYRCAPQADKSVTVTEVTDVTLVYQQADTLDVSQVKVDAAAAAQAAASATTTTASAAPSA
ncbi:MAG: hypothetical protein JWM80_1877, partial [Cyanobacteria bacterium RYN_339]|nr:hypothetical protein [Cyanobacteria bacterium RYN_339]